MRGGIIIGAENEGTASRDYSERLGERVKLEWVSTDEEDGEGSPPHVGRSTRTNTDATLVDGKEEDREVG